MICKFYIENANKNCKYLGDEALFVYESKGRLKGTGVLGA